MKRWFVGLSLVAALLPAAVFAQIASPGAYGTSSSTSLFVGMPLKLAQQLQSDPSLIDNPGYLARHPDLVSWMQMHPDQAQQLQAQASLLDVTDSNGMVYGSAVGTDPFLFRHRHFFFNPLNANTAFFNGGVTGAGVPPGTPIGPNGLPIGGFAGNGQLGAIGPNGLPIGGVTSSFAPGTTLGPNGLPIAPVPNQPVGGAFPAGTVLSPNGLPIPGSGVTLPVGGTQQQSLVRPTGGQPGAPVPPAGGSAELHSTPTQAQPSALQKYLMSHPNATHPAPPPALHPNNTFHDNHPSPSRPGPAHVAAPKPASTHVDKATPHDSDHKKKKKKHQDND